MSSKYLDLVKKGVVLFDGAMGTMLYQKGIFVNRSFEEANLSAPNLVREVHSQMAEAGAMVLTSNSYGANSLKLQGYALSHQTKAINLKAIEIAKSVASSYSPNLLVAASVGPLGQRLEPLGKISIQKAKEVFREQIEALLEGQPDLFIFETFSDIYELELAVGVLRELNSTIPTQAHFSLSFDKSKNNLLLAKNLAKRLDQNPSIDVIGTNCILGPDYMLEVVKEVLPTVNKPFCVMPNAGLPKEVEGRQIYMASPEYFAEYALRFLEAGVKIIGGCCGTTPSHIEKIGKAVLSLDKGHKQIQIVQSATESDELMPIGLADRSKLGNALATNKFIKFVELVPPAALNFDLLLSKVESLSKIEGCFINLPDGPRASSRLSAFSSAGAIKNQGLLNPIPHLCARDKNLIALQSDMLSCEAAGIRDLLFITGDPPKVGNFPDVTGVFDVDSLGLITLANRLNRGIDLSGKSLKGQCAFTIGAGANPVSPFLEKEIERTLKKAELGADYFLTQPVFDADTLISFIEKTKSCGKPFIAGIWPFSSYKNALFMKNEVPGVVVPDSVLKRMEAAASAEAAREEGIKIALEIIEKVKPYVSGIEISPPLGKIDIALEVFERL